MHTRSLLSAIVGALFTIILVGLLAVQHSRSIAYDDVNAEFPEQIEVVDASSILPKTTQGTVVTGTVSGTWNLTNSPYLAIGALFVEEGQTLTISSGVEIRFAGLFGLSVEGDLVVNGTTDAPVIFTSDLVSPQPGDWSGIMLTNSSESTKLNYVNIEYAESGIKIVAEDGVSSPIVEFAKIINSSRDGIQIYANSAHINTIAKPKVLNSEISNSGSTGIRIRANGGIDEDIHGIAEPEVRNNVITDSGDRGIHINATGGRNSWAHGIAKGQFFDNVVKRSGSSGILIRGAGGSVGCYPYPCIWGSARPEVVGNVVSNNGYQGISIVAHAVLSGYQSEGIARPIVANNIVTNNKDAGIGGSASNVLEEYSPKILNNTIVNNGEEGIHIPRNVATKVGSDHDIVNNIIFSNTIGIGADDEIPEVWCNDLWANTTNFAGFPTDYGVLDSTNANGDPSDKYFNILLDPLFVDMNNADYHLLEDSPAIDAGCDHEDARDIDFDSELRPQGERYDIGADEYYLGSDFKYYAFLPTLLKK